MYPVSSVASGATASSGDSDNEDDGGTKGGTVQSDDLQKVEVTTLPSSVGKGVSNRGEGRGRAQNLRPVLSKRRKRLGSGNKCEVDTGSRSLLLLEGGCDQSPSKFVKLLFYRDQPGSVSATSTASTVTPPENAGSSLPVTRTTSTTVGITTAKGGVRTSGKGKRVLRTSSKSKSKAPALKRGTSVFSSAFTIDSDVLGSLGVMLSPKDVRVIESIFFKMDVFSRLTYKSMVAKQLPSDVSGKLTVTGRAIWYLTYRVMCEDSFVFKCLGRYHYKHRPNFIRALPSIQVLSDSSDLSTAPLSGDKLLDFLSVLDGAMSSKLKSVFNSCWSEVSVSLEEEALNAVSCKDLVDVLDIAGIPQLALSAMAATRERPERSKGIAKCRTSEISVIPPLVLSAMIAASAERERNKGTAKCTTSETSVTGLTCPLPSSSQSLSLQSNPGLSPRALSQSESQLGSSLTLMEAPGTSSELILPSSVVDADGGSSSNKCVDLLGVKLHPDSAKLVLQLLHDLDKSFKHSFLLSIRGYILETLGSELSVIEKAIWCKTYREQHLYRFMHRSICIYHSKYRPRFVRALDGVRVLSSSSDRRLVPLIGGELLGFLSELDCAVHKTVEYIFDSLWSKTTDTVFAELEDGSLGDVSCEDFIRVLDVAGIPVVAFSIARVYNKKNSQVRAKRRAISESKTSESSGRRVEGEGSVSGVLNSLGVMLSPKDVRVIEGLFFDMDAFARRTYKSMVAKQLPSDVSDRLTVTGRAIWYLTYKVMCEDSLLFKCLGKYHYKHRPNFIRALPSIQVLSDSTDHSTEPLAGDRLLDFLSVLDGAISSRVKSVFNSCWSEVSVSLEEERLNAVSCKDLIDVLDTAGIPHLALSAMIATKAGREISKGTDKCTTSEISAIPPLVLSAMIAANAERERNKGIGKCTTSEINVTGLTHSLPSGSKSLSLQSNPGLSPRALSQSESQLGSSLPLMEASGTSSELILPSPVVDADDGSSSNKCVDLLGVKLHPDSAKLVLQLLHDLDKSFKNSFSHSMRGYILEALGSELSVIEKAIWCKTYREQHLYRFMHRSICIYHSKYRPRFVRVLDGVRVLSSSSDCGLVPLIGGELLSFLSELDCVVHKTVECIFDSSWSKITDKVFSELEDGSLSDVSCEDFIRVLDVAGVPVVAFSITQVHNKKNSQIRAKRCAISESKTSESSSKRVKGKKGSVIDATNLTHSSAASLSQLQSQPELTLQLQIQPESSLTLVTESVATPTVSDQSCSVSVADTISISVVLPGAESPSVTESVAMPTLSGDSFLIISGDVLVSVAEGVASDSVVGDELSVEPSSSFSPLLAPESDLVVASDIPPPLSPSAKELVAVDTVYASMGAEDGSLSPPSSPSIEPSSSSLSLSSSPSSAGLDGDISFSSSHPESPVSTGEIELTAEGVLSASLGASVGESTPVFSSEQPIVPVSVSSSVSVSASVSKSFMAAGSSSSRYPHGPKKAFIMQSVEAPMSSVISAGPSSSTPVNIGNVPLVAAVTDTAAEEDVGVRLAALLNRGLPPSPPPAGESSRSRGGRGGLSSSHSGGAQRSRGRKRKRNS
ncbi:hypothetical protein [Candidatus Ichthyocystis sparus]|uniref:hypothetical protein n=3 Tax=Candidatus Ichthyocystis sparus TaxID=1561004 RepID=UPI000B8A345C|nr:hypothetical protein [Candidatus Ichthyocystis sparus]